MPGFMWARRHDTRCRKLPLEFAHIEQYQCFRQRRGQRDGVCEEGHVYRRVPEDPGNEVPEHDREPCGQELDDGDVLQAGTNWYEVHVFPDRQRVSAVLVYDLKGRWKVPFRHFPSRVPLYRQGKSSNFTWRSVHSGEDTNPNFDILSGGHYRSGA